MNLKWICYCSDSSLTLAARLRKNLIQGWAGSFCGAKFPMSLRIVTGTGYEWTVTGFLDWPEKTEIYLAFRKGELYNTYMQVAGIVYW